jgi:hypothetical protein
LSATGCSPGKRSDSNGPRRAWRGSISETVWMRSALRRGARSLTASGLICPPAGTATSRCIRWRNGGGRSVRIAKGKDPQAPPVDGGLTAIYGSYRSAARRWFARPPSVPDQS